MVEMFIRNYPKKSEQILDPFAGSCTTLFASREMGFNSYGIELLPIGAFILKSRKAADSVKTEPLVKTINTIKKIDFLKKPTDHKTSLKHITITNKAFPEDTEYKLNAFLKYINDEGKDENIKQILRFACFCILEKISYTRKDGQYLRWDYRANKGKNKFNKGKIYSFEEALIGQLNQIASDIRNINVFGEKHYSKDIEVELMTGSCLEILPTLKEESFDLVISSPPYCNRYDYTRTYALELVFLGVDEEEIRRLRQGLLSCTVENKDKIEFLRDIYKKNGQLDLFKNAEDAFDSNEALQEVLSILELYKKQKKLNNLGIYRMVKNYFYEHSFVIFEMARLLKKGGRIYYVNDNVRYAGESIPVDLILSEFAEEAGLTIKSIYKLANGKGNSSQQMGAHGRTELRKCVYYWEK
jgi:DNA modification methylase